VVGVWESEEAAGRFGTILGPILQQVGVMTSMVTCMLVAMSLLAMPGIRYPEAMLPILFSRWRGN
jgi:hypothetical protein